MGGRGEGGAERLGQDVCEGSKKAGGGVCAEVGGRDAQGFVAGEVLAL